MNEVLVEEWGGRVLATGTVFIDQYPFIFLLVNRATSADLYYYNTPQRYFPYLRIKQY